MDPLALVARILLVMLGTVLDHHDSSLVLDHVGRHQRFAFGDTATTRH
jgi:hypothetical protein